MYQEVTALMEHTSLSAETPPDCVSGPSVCVGHKARELILAGDHIPLAPPGDEGFVYGIVVPVPVKFAGAAASKSLSLLQLGCSSRLGLPAAVEAVCTLWGDLLSPGEQALDVSFAKGSHVAFVAWKPADARETLPGTLQLFLHLLGAPITDFIDQAVEKTVGSHFPDHTAFTFVEGSLLERVQSHFRELVTPIMGFRKSMLEFTAEDLKILKRNSFTSHDLRVEVNKGPLIVQYEHRSFEVVFRPRLKRLEPDVSTALRSQNDEHYNLWGKFSKVKSFFAAHPVATDLVDRLAEILRDMGQWASVLEEDFLQLQDLADQAFHFCRQLESLVDKAEECKKLETEFLLASGQILDSEDKDRLEKFRRHLDRDCQLLLENAHELCDAVEGLVSRSGIRFFGQAGEAGDRL